jgi:hypothetical protein
MDTGADHEWVDWLRGLLKTGADALGAQPAGDPVLGLRGRTAGCRVTTGARAGHRHRHGSARSDQPG